jgi:hypothetical protein
VVEYPIPATLQSRRRSPSDHWSGSAREGASDADTNLFSGDADRRRPCASGAMQEPTADAARRSRASHGSFSRYQARHHLPRALRCTNKTRVAAHAMRKLTRAPGAHDRSRYGALHDLRCVCPDLHQADHLAFAIPCVGNNERASHLLATIFTRPTVTHIISPTLQHAVASGVRKRMLARFANEDSVPQRRAILEVRGAFEAAGVAFNDEGAAGIRLRRGS